ncbi:MAG: helix-turn-helix domain-containing protein [Candidatus Methanofastidiosia archaeon]|jgi:DNA-binding transcriptional ArsR family regulator
MNLDDILQVFSTDEEKAKLLAMQIANDRGREVLEYIYKGKPLSASDISDDLDIPLPTVMFHIDRFLEIGIIKIVKTRMSKKLREIKYYGPAKRAFLIIPYQKEETMSSIRNAVKTSVVTPVTMALVLVVSGIVGYIVNHTLTQPPTVQRALVEAEKGATDFYAEEAASKMSSLSLTHPVILVVLGCITTLVLLNLYAYLKK